MASCINFFEICFVNRTRTKKPKPILLLTQFSTRKLLLQGQALINLKCLKIISFYFVFIFRIFDYLIPIFK